MAQDKIIEINSGIGKSQVNFIECARTYLANRLLIKNHFVRELLAEVIGTEFLIMMGLTGGASQVLSRNEKGDVVSANLSWGFGVFFAILMGQNISGGHYNPAVTFTFAMLGKLPWKKVIPYWLAQIFGAFIGAAIVFITYYDAINAFDGGVRQIDGPNGTAGIFATYPQPFLSLPGAIFDQIMATCGLLLAVLVCTDTRNGLPSYLTPFAVAFYVTINGFTFSYNAGGGINPARDFGPRLLTAVAGYGADVFSYRNYTWFWIPIICPLIGGVLAAVVYNGMVGIHYPKDDESSDTNQTPCGPQCTTTFAKLLMKDPGLKQVYLTQQSLDFLESVGKRESIVPLVR